MFERIVNKINNTVKEYKNYDYNTGFICKKPIIRILSAQNKEINNLKKIISPDHLLPTDILNGAKSVISFFLLNSKDVNFGGGRVWKEYMQRIKLF